MIALITERADLAADILVTRLLARNERFARINCDEFPSRITARWLSEGDDAEIVLGAQTVRTKEISAAWFRRAALAEAPGQHSTRSFVAQQSAAFVEGLWGATDCVWVNRPDYRDRAENKMLQLHEARAVGFSVPPTCITNDPTVAREFAIAHGAIVAKALVSGSVVDEGQRYALFTQEVAIDDLRNDAELRCSPTIYQKRVKKECDTRVIVVGPETFCVDIVAPAECTAVDWRSVDQQRLVYRIGLMSPDTAARCVSICQAFGLMYSALDFVRAEDGELIFLELNPSGQWGWLEAETGLPIADRIVDLLQHG